MRAASSSRMRVLPIWREIEPALAAIDGAEARLAALLHQGDRITLAVPPAVAGWVAPAVAGFMQWHPGITVVLRPRQPSAQRGGPGANAPDAGAEIRFGDGSWAGMQARYLLGREAVWWSAGPGLASRADCAQGHRRAAATHPAACPGAPGLARMDGCDGPRARQAACRGGFRIRAVLDAPGSRLAGLGLAVVPRFLVAEHLCSGALVAPFGEVVRLQAGYYFVIPKALRAAVPCAFSRITGPGSSTHRACCPCGGPWPRPGITPQSVSHSVSE
jgi:DNA-binding transcriptional LysR family regulator